MALPYAAFPKYGPSVLGQAQYDADLHRWELYQASLRNTAVEIGSPEDFDESDEPAGDLDTFTYLRKYVKSGQSRKRIFREQNIKALEADHALRQGRDAMEAELGPRDNPDEERFNWKPVPGTEKASKPRGKAFAEGEDERRNDEGTNGSTGEAKPDNMPANDPTGSQQEQGNAEGDSDGDPGDGEANENESSQGEGEGGQGDDQQGEDDTPKMPTCAECGQQRGTTEGCCAPAAKSPFQTLTTIPIMLPGIERAKVLTCLRTLGGI